MLTKFLRTCLFIKSTSRIFCNKTKEDCYSSVLNNRSPLIIIRAEFMSEVWAQESFRQKVLEVTGLINGPGFPKHRINLNNRPGKKKIQAMLSKVTE